MTSGGTESIVMAVKTYRDWARATKGITEPEMLVTGSRCATVISHPFQDCSRVRACCIRQGSSVLEDQTPHNTSRLSYTPGRSRQGKEGNVSPRLRSIILVLLTRSFRKKPKYDHGEPEGSILSVISMGSLIVILARRLGSKLPRWKCG